MAKPDKKEKKEPREEKIDVNENEGIVYLPPVKEIKRG
jgi:hypothetical protein